MRFLPIGRWVELAALLASILILNFPAAAECPVDLSNYNPSQLYFGGSQPRLFEKGATESIKRSAPMSLFYVLKQSGGSPLGGAISVKRTYFLTYPGGEANKVGIWKNYPKGSREQWASLTSYSNYHLHMGDDDPTFSNGLHVRYGHSEKRSDDTNNKRLTFLPHAATELNAWHCPTTVSDSFMCKAMVLRFKAIAEHGSCLPIDLFTTEDGESDLIGAVSSIFLEIYELDAESGPTQTFRGNVNLVDK